MPSYNTRSAARKRALESCENAIASPSTTGKGANIRQTYSSNEEIPTISHSNTLESVTSFERPATPNQDEDEDEDEEFQRSPTTSSIDIDIAEDHQYSPADRAIIERMLAQLQEQKKVVEQRAADAARAFERRKKLQPKSGRPGDPTQEVADLPGQKLPLGVARLGRTGTWVDEKIWRPNFVHSTTELPSIHEDGALHLLLLPRGQGPPPMSRRKISGGIRVLGR